MRRKKVDESKINEIVPEARGIIGSLLKTYRNNNQILVLINGKMGSGKSYAGLRIIELFYEKGNFGKKIEPWHIIRNQVQFYEAILQASEGTQLLIEEASVLFNSRRSQSSENISFTNILDIARKRKIGFYLTFPLTKSVDKHARKLASHSVKMLTVNRDKGFSVARIRTLQYNESNDVLYPHKLKVEINGKFKDIDKCWLGLAKTQGLLQEYEKLKDSFIQEHFERELAKAKKKEHKIKQELYGLSPVKEEKDEKLFKRNKIVLDLLHQGMTQTEVAKYMNLSVQTIWAINKKARTGGK